MKTQRKWIERAAEAEFRQVRKEYPVVTIIGPRQSGKTSLVRKYCKGYTYTNLENPDTRRFAEEDPRGFFQSNPTPMIIDEVQRVPELLSYIQVLADETSERGQYILTGSNQMALSSAISQSLAGRTALLKLLPLSLVELQRADISLTRDELLYQGFMPRLYHEPIRPNTLYAEYFQNYVERDLRLLTAVRNLTVFEKFMRVLAGRIGHIINISSLSNDVGISRETVHEWLATLETSFLIFRLPPWFENAGKRSIKTPKLYFTEPGLAAWLLDIDSPSQIARDPLLGNLFENMVVVEALKARTNAGRMSNLYFHRDGKGNEVDLVVQHQRKLYPFEIKASMTYSSDMAKGFKPFKKRFPDSHPGTILYAGDQEFQSDQTSLANFQKISQLITPKP